MRRAGIRGALLVAMVCLLASEGRAVELAKPRHVETCEEAAERLFGREPARLPGLLKPPVRLHYVKPTYPQDPLCTNGRGKWVGEALIGPDGRIQQLTVLRDSLFKPNHPECGQAIASAVREWRYAPTVVQGKPTPVCMTVSVTVDSR
jgi:hypothetical protein